MDRPIAALAAFSFILLLASAACAFLLLARWALTGRVTQSYLLWNLGLAWCPYAIALCFFALAKIPSKTTRRILAAILGFAWLIFYPNSPYIFTDMIHVINRSFLNPGNAEWLSAKSLIWYDIILNSTFAFVGHFIGLISLYVVQINVRALWNRATAWAVAAFAIALAGTGIYIGRFVRVNSWDILTAPVATARLIARGVFEPKAFLLSAAFSAFIAATYLMLYMFRKVKLPEPGL